MATKFLKTELVAQVDEYYNDLIEEAERAYSDLLENRGSIADQRDKWRAAETNRIRDFLRRLDEEPDRVPDYELAAFTTRKFSPKHPDIMLDSWDRDSRDGEGERLKKRIEWAKDRHQKAARFVRSLATDETGAVGLSLADLRYIGIVPKD